MKKILIYLLVVLATAVTSMFARVDGAGRAAFTVTVRNKSEKTYVFERVIEGSDVGIEGIYGGNEISCAVSGIAALDELLPGATKSFTVTVTVPSGVTTDAYSLKFNFIEKTGTEILPGNPDTPDPPVDPEPEEPDELIVDIYHEDVWGLITVLVSDKTNCLNDSNMIYNAVIKALKSNNRPAEDAPILHCHVNSISGGTMTDVANQANANLSKKMHFIFEADPNNANRMYLYVYHETDCTDEKLGTEIAVYKQVLTRNSEGTWVTDGTYLGKAKVAYVCGGGNNGKDMLTVDPYTWTAGAPVSIGP